MRLPSLTIGSFLVAASVLAAQSPQGNQPIIPTPGGGNGAGPTQPANIAPVLNPNNRLDFLLLQWEQRMKGVESIYAPKLTREEKEKTGAIRKFEGEARYLRPNLAALRMIRVDDPTKYELYISTGINLYEFRPQTKTLRIHDMTPAQAGQFQNNFLSFLFGMNAADAKQKFELDVQKDVGPANPNFIYIMIKPRLDADKREFTRAQLVLKADTLLPRRLWFEHANGNSVTWDIPEMTTDQNLKPQDFTPPKAPEGWETVRVRNDSAPPTAPKLNSNPPRVIRPSGR